MDDQRWPAGSTMLQRVAAALQTMPSAWQHPGTVSLAAMYAEAIDDDDQGDGLFRFGPKLRAALESLGLGTAAPALLLPPPAAAGLCGAAAPGLSPRPAPHVQVGPWPERLAEEASAA